MNEELWLPILIIVSAIVIIGIVIQIILIGSRAKNDTNSKEKELNKIKAINEKVLKELETKGFRVSQKCFISHRNASKDANLLKNLMICVDAKNKKICFVDYEKQTYKIVSNAEFVGFKLINDKGTISEKEFSALGGVAAIPLALLSMSELDGSDIAYKNVDKKVCKRLILQIVINDSNDPIIDYTLIKKPVELEMGTYKRVVDSAMNAIEFLNKIEHGAPEGKRMVFCRYCGVKNDADAKYCIGCGSPIEE